MSQDKQSVFKRLKRQTLLMFYDIRIQYMKRGALTGSIGNFLRLLPLVLLVVFLKVYVVMLLFSSGLIGKTQHPGTHQAVPERQSLSESSSLEKLNILSNLDTTTIVPSSANRTPDTQWLFFNRLPRSGGSTMVSLMEALGVDLDFEHQEHTYRTPWQRLMTKDEQKNLATWFEYNFWLKSYDRKALFINFTEHMSSYTSMRPATMTLLRDPIMAFVSQFHSRRTNPEVAKNFMVAAEMKSPGAGRRWYWRKLEDCVLEGDEECALDKNSKDFERSVPFLCGQLEQCLSWSDPKSLQRAKYMLEYEYSVVGVLEGWNATLSVLEHYLPAFFQGARQRYWSTEFESRRRMNPNRRKVSSLSPRVVKTLKQKLAVEYELYEFAKQRLAKQYQSIEPLLQYTSALPPMKEDPVKKLSVWERFDIEMNY